MTAKYATCSPALRSFTRSARTRSSSQTSARRGSYTTIFRRWSSTRRLRPPDTTRSPRGSFQSSASRAWSPRESSRLTICQPSAANLRLKPNCSFTARSASHSRADVSRARSSAGGAETAASAPSHAAFRITGTARRRKKSAVNTR